MAKVLIAGCGYVGTALACVLAADGHEVFALRRRVDRLPAGLRPIEADLTDVDSLRRLPGGIDVVFYTASADARDDRSYRSAYVDGLRHLLAALEGRALRRVLYASSTGVYAQQGGEWVDENSPAEPRHFSGVRLIEGETLVGRSRHPATVVRLAGIYGPGREGLLDRVRRGEATFPAGPPVYANRIHRDDCVGVLRHLMSLERVEPLYVAADDEPAAMAVVLGWIAERLGVPPPRTVAQPGPQMRYGGSSNKRVTNARLLASGYRFRYPTFREGYAALIDEAAAAVGE
jgi:nucleoside-diphosphate-sugar epimerase